jgi:hypothetical protein
MKLFKKLSPAEKLKQAVNDLPLKAYVDVKYHNMESKKVADQFLRDLTGEIPIHDSYDLHYWCKVTKGNVSYTVFYHDEPERT